MEGMEQDREDHPHDPADTRSTDGAEPESRNMLVEHKGKLALGLAATLGLMVLYNWLEKQLEQEDPEDFKRLQKFTAPFKPEDELEQEEFERRQWLERQGSPSGQGAA